MNSPFFPATIELMRRDADFADKMWQLYTVNAQFPSLDESEAARADRIRHELGERISQVFGLNQDDAAKWLCDYVVDVVEYYGANYPYGGRLHKRSGVALLFRIIKNRRVPSKSEFNTALVISANLFFTVLCPLLFLSGALQYQPIFSLMGRAYFMGLGVVAIVIARIVGIYAKKSRQLLIASEMRRRYSSDPLHQIFGPSTPLRISLSSEVSEGIGKGMIFYAAGTFLNTTYTLLELILAIAGGIDFLYGIFSYAFKKG
jgi:hypothetical protein